MGQKFGLVQQAAPAVSPNAEDLSLILGSMARGRSFSTTMNPKQSDITTVATAKDKSTIVDTSMVQKRKKSVPNTQKEKYVFLMLCYFLFFYLIIFHVF